MSPTINDLAPGHVWLVGAGPGDPDLITLKAARALANADAVVHDALVSAEVLAFASPSSDLIDVGKRAGRPVEQEMISALLVSLAEQGKRVVRLKGGDPFVFGRGGEEVATLLAAGVPFQVVPGISSAVAAPALAGIPVTMRGVSPTFSVVTGHRSSGEPPVDWGALVKLGGTIVVLMGVAEREHIATELIAAGADPATPIAAISHAATPNQSVTRGHLYELAGLEIETPAVLVIGEVAALQLIDQGIPSVAPRLPLP